MTALPQDFVGRSAIVTGGTRGIGYGIAAELLGRGASVMITARKPAELDAALATLGGEFGADRVRTSRGSADDVEHQGATVAATVEAFGHVDVMVNNAAVNPHFGPLVDAPLDAVRKIYEVNVIACLGWVQACWRAGMAERGGAVLNIASVGGVRNGPMIGAYNTSKAALIHLTRQLAQEMGPGVRVNAMAPAVVKTDFAKALWEHNEDAAAAGYPLKRLGVAADTSKLAAFLLGPDATWITGECVVIDGGVTVAF